MEFAIILELLNAAMLVALLYVYVQNYRQMKNAFVLGLIIFAFFLLAQNAVAIYFHIVMIDYYSKDVMAQAFWMTAMQSVGLAALLWATWKQ